MSVVLVTGASRGLGSVTAQAFARAEHQVFGGVRSEAAASKLAGYAAAEGLSVQPVQLDVTSDNSVAGAIEHIRQVAERIDILVSNAGIGHPGSVEFTAEDVIRTVFETNTFGLLRLLRGILPIMREQRSGTIVAVTSLAGAVPAPGMGVYAASKHAVTALMEALWLEVAPFGIRVICVEPGPFRTAITDQVNAKRTSEAESPYRPLLDELRTRRMARLALAEDAASFADCVVQAACSEGTPLHVPIGELAKRELGRSGGLPLRYLQQLRAEIAAG
jgi:NAD(P)-dependent dehydrogenase (short-subunit alcohol dehydrogenase family)